DTLARFVARHAGHAGLGEVDLGVFVADQPAAEDAELGHVTDEADMLALQVADEPADAARLAVRHQVFADYELGFRVGPVLENILGGLAGAEERAGDELFEFDVALAQAVAEVAGLLMADIGEWPLGVVANPLRPRRRRVGMTNQVQLHGACSPW